MELLRLREIVLEQVFDVHAFAHKNLLAVHGHQCLVAEGILLLELIVNYRVVCCPWKLFEVGACVSHRWVVLDDFLVAADLGAISDSGSLHSDSLHFKYLFPMSLVPTVLVDVHDQLVLVLENLINSCLNLKLIIFQMAVLNLLLLRTREIFSAEFIRIVIKDLFGERLIENLVVSTSSYFELPCFEQLVLLLQLLQSLFLGQDPLLIRNGLRYISRWNGLAIVLLRLLILIGQFKLIKRLNDGQISLNIERLLKGLIIDPRLLFNFSALLLNLHSRNLLADVDILTHLLEISKSMLGLKELIFVTN